MTSYVRGALPSVRWSSIISGALCAIAIHIVMGLFGTAMGFAASPADSRGLGGVAVLWAILTPLVATFIGAYVAVRLSGNMHKASNILHGVLVWCIGLIAGALFLSTVLTGAGSGVADAAARVQGNVTQERVQGTAEDVAKGAAAGSGLAGLAALFGLGGAFLGAAAGRKSVRDDFEGERVLERPYREEEVRTGSTSVSSKSEGTGIPPYGH
jgi:hypothetical protein